MKEIWLIREDDVEFLVYDDPACESMIVARKAGTRATLEALVSLCDRAAEDCNAHDFVGTHRLLGAVLHSLHGRKKATETMLFIAEREGLHGMSGLCGREDAYGELGVGELGRDWHGSFGP